LEVALQPMALRSVQTTVLEGAQDDVLAKRAPEDFEAFAELYRRYLTPVYKFVRSQTPDEATAEDVTAHVFYKALASSATFRGDGSYRSWVFRIAHNSLVSWRSRAGKAVIVEEVPETVDPSPTPASQALEREKRGFVWQTVAELPPAQREVVALRYLEDLDIEEIAEVSERSRGAVRILLHRARMRLRHALEGKDVT
jgi:RNA polymerase sigma-70 factor, ECF subfamily